MTIKTMSARFDAKCPACGKAIQAGEQIRYDSSKPKGYKAVHLACAGITQQSSQQPQQTVSQIITEGGLTYNADRSCFRHFDSVSEYCDLTPSELNRTGFESYLASTKDYKSDWFGTGRRDWKEAKQISETSWDAGVKRLSELADGYINSGSATDIKRRLSRSDDGDEIDIHRVYSGDLDTAWSRKSRRQRFTPPTVTLAAQIGGACYRSSDQLFWRGAAVAKLADLLAAAGYNVEIIGVAAAYGFINAGEAGSLYGHSITIKQAGMPMDMASIASTICFAGFVRYQLFKALTSFDKKIGGHYGTFGKDVSLDKIAELTISKFSHGTPIMVPNEIFDRNSADAWITKQIDKLNGHEEAA